MKKLSIFVLFMIQTIVSFSQSIEVKKFTGDSYGTANLYETDVYVKPGGTLTLKIIVNESVVNDFSSGTGYALGITSNASFFTNLDSIRYSETNGGADTYTFGIPALVGNTGINQTLDISGNASVDIIEIVNIDIKIPTSLTEGTYDLQLTNDFISGIVSPKTILTFVCERADISVQNLSEDDVTLQTLKVQKGQTLTFDVSIVEPSSQNDFFSATTTFNNLDLLVPTGFTFKESYNSNTLDFN